MVFDDPTMHKLVHKPVPDSMQAMTTVAAM
jgi:hypothetical protein